MVQIRERFLAHYLFQLPRAHARFARAGLLREQLVREPRDCGKMHKISSPETGHLVPAMGWSPAGRNRRWRQAARAFHKVYVRLPLQLLARTHLLEIHCPLHAAHPPAPRLLRHHCHPRTPARPKCRASHDTWWLGLQSQRGSRNHFTSVSTGHRDAVLDVQMEL